jgi:hypothetical protein
MGQWNSTTAPGSGCESLYTASDQVHVSCDDNGKVIRFFVGPSQQLI